MKSAWTTEAVTEESVNFVVKMRDVRIMMIIIEAIAGIGASMKGVKITRNIILEIAEIDALMSVAYTMGSITQEIVLINA